ncbi:DNA-binding transcriptional regulator, LysR family [Aeromonas sp. RU39B]|uniref:LysR substrate-binding domain-containing protein n=1 Tax=Aeromonas sp. RU39B TaxID=1907416 RepID=UPI0009574E20|nr:LysR substrate-binding domain-containing protein [Aeromonas sp. RU39B]SIQ22084.1 DNA-binding transcriptional regulator, LysR family [Aeromonas sp. RU39B]
MNITLKQLKVFSAVARHGNLGDAAQALFLSRGALSQALQELERQLATPLFDRIHPRLLLNSEGRLLQPLAEELLSRLDDIEGLFAEHGMERGRLRLGASQTIGNYLLPTLLARFGMPGERLEVTISNSHQLCDRLARFELDLALIEGECHLSELVSEPWLSDEMVVVAHPDHQLCGLPDLRVAALAGERWVLREPQSGSREQFDQRIRPQLGRIGPILELNTLESVMSAVECALGLGLVSEWAARERLAQKRLVRLDLATTLERRLLLVWHRQKYLSAPMRHFLTFCRDQVSADSNMPIT